MEIILISIMGVILLVAVILYISNLSDKYGKSRFDDIIFLKNKIILLSNIYHSGGDGDPYTNCRISEIEPINGKINKRIVLIKFNKLNVLGEINGKIWLKDEKFCVLDSEKFKIVFDQFQIGEKLPELKNDNVKRFFFNEIDKKVYFLAENGFRYFINPENFEISRSEFFQEEQEIISKNKKINNSTKFGIKNIFGTERCEILFQKKSINNELSFIKPDFLRTTTTNEIVEIAKSEKIAILHYDSLNNLSNFKITLLSSTGNIYWTINQEEMLVKNDTVSEQKAVLKYVDFQKTFLTLVFSAKQDRIIRIDLKDGKIIWNLKI